MNQFEADYLNLCREVKYSGTFRESRAGRTVGKFGTMLRIDDLRSNLFPIVTTRKMFPRPIFGELAAFLWGHDRLQQFKDMGCNYWDMNAAQWSINEGVAKEDQLVGRIYGVQWRNWEYGVDQLKNLIDGIQRDPFGRRHIMTTWNPGELAEMCLPPCHILVQAYVNASGHIDLSVTMRSVDLCLGLPSDIALYAGFLILLANATSYKPGSLVFQLGDTHIYENHLATLTEQFTKEPLALPTWDCNNIHMDRFFPDELTLIGYTSHESMKYVLN